MPAKESAKARKEREKAERLALAQAQERQDAELDEDKARQIQELQERLERDEIYLEYYERLVHPRSHLMVPYTAYAEIRAKMQQEGACSAERVMTMQEEMYAMQKAHAALQQELVHIRNENRALAAKVATSMEGVATSVESSLNDCLDGIQASILRQREDARETAQHLHTTLEQSKLKARQLTDDTLAAAHRVTALLQENTSMHSRIPRRIRGILHTLEKDDLLMILDTLSFDEPALHYLLYRFPPGMDDPFAMPEAVLNQEVSDVISRKVSTMQERASSRNIRDATGSATSSRTPRSLGGSFAADGAPSAAAGNSLNAARGLSGVGLLTTSMYQ